MSLTSAMRSGSPLAVAGPRKCVQVSQQSAVNVGLAASAHGITQRIVLDELLLDAELVDRAARRAARRISQTARQTGSNAVARRESGQTPLRT